MRKWLIGAVVLCCPLVVHAMDIGVRANNVTDTEINTFGRTLKFGMTEGSWLANDKPMMLLSCLYDDGGTEVCLQHGRFSATQGAYAVTRVQGRFVNAQGRVVTRTATMFPSEPWNRTMGIISHSVTSAAGGKKVSFTAGANGFSSFAKKTGVIVPWTGTKHFFQGARVFLPVAPFTGSSVLACYGGHVDIPLKWVMSPTPDYKISSLTSPCYFTVKGGGVVWSGEPMQDEEQDGDL